MSKQIKDVQQEEVLQTTGFNQIVSASAGSGKTTIMIKKILNILDTKRISIKNILVLTYTKAAATEMKQRLERELSLLQEDDFYKQQLDDLSLADITTFHAFYQKLVKKYFYLLNISANFSIADENITSAFKDIALNKALEEFSKTKNEEYLLFYEMFSRGRSNKQIKEMILNFDTYYLNIAEENFKQKALDFFQSDFSENYIKQYISKTINSLINQLKLLLTKADTLSFQGYVKNINATLSMIDFDYDKFSISKTLEILSNYKTVSITQDKSDDIGLIYEIRKVKTNLKDFINKVLGFNFGTVSDIEKSKEICSFAVKILFELQELFAEKYLAHKLSKNIYDFDDLEKFTFRLLQNIDIQNEIKQDYDFIFIDEFQDANARQEEIINLICKRNNRFMVGDVKQSIYQFRQSKPDIFLYLEEKYQKDKNSKSQKLNSNFRSHKDILNFINLVFDKIMTKENSGIDYRLCRFNPVIEYQNNDLPRVEIDILEKSEKESLEFEKTVYSVKNHEIYDDEEDKAEKEASIVAEKIAELRKRKIYDRKTGQMRDVEYGDIAVLLRTRGSYLNSFASKFTSLNIPVIQNLNSNLLDTNEGCAFKNLMNTVKNPTDELKLGLLMLSPLGNFTEEELATIKQGEAEDLLSLCTEYASKNSDYLTEKVNCFFSDLSTLRKDIKYLDASIAILNYYKNIKLEERLLAYENGEKSYLYFVSLAKTFESNMSLNEFISSNNMFLPLPKLEKHPSCIEITTIHASKGLEYPIVFLCASGDNFNKSPSQSPIAINDKFGVATKYYDIENNTEHGSLFYETIKLQNKKEEFAEKLRLLYVALSRAQNHLYIVGTQNIDNFYSINNDYETSIQNNYLSLIVGALGDNIINKLRNGQKEISGENFQIHVYENEKTIKKNISSKIPSIAISPSVESEELINSITHEYLFDKETNLALKNSVSSLNEYEDYASKNYLPKDLTISEHLAEISKNDLGTLYHKVLQFVEFDKIESKEDLLNELSSLLKVNKITEDCLDLDVEILFKNICLIKTMCKNSKVFKEQYFMMKVPYNDVVDSSIEEEILIQGIVDLLIVGEKNIIIDYKFTSVMNDDILINRYKKQILLYKKAVELSSGINVKECYLLSLKQAKLIKIN